MPLPKRVLSIPPPPILSVKPDGTKNGEVAMRQVSLIQITRIVNQMSEIALFAEEMFQDLVLLTNNTTKRIINLSERIDKLIENLPEIEIIMMKQSVIKLSDRIEWKSNSNTAHNLFTFQTTPYSLLQHYHQKCIPAPALHLLDVYRTDGGSCRAFFSFPEFFAQEWRRIVLQELEAKKIKRSIRKSRRRKELGLKEVVSEINVKKYNSEGELMLDDGVEMKRDSFKLITPSITSPKVEVQSPSIQVNLSKQVDLKDDTSTQPKQDNVDHLVSTPVHPPSPVARTSTTLSINQIDTTSVKPQETRTSKSGKIDTSTPIQQEPRTSKSIKSGTPTLNRQQINSTLIETLPPLPKKDIPKLNIDTVRAGVLNDIRGALFKLKSIGPTEKKKKILTPNKMSPFGNEDDVQVMLRRRAALEMSDSDSSSDDDDDEW